MVIYIITLTHKTCYARIGAGERQAYSFTPAHCKKYGELNTHTHTHTHTHTDTDTHRFILHPLDRSVLSYFCLSSFIPTYSVNFILPLLVQISATSTHSLSFI